MSTYTARLRSFLGISSAVVAILLVTAVLVAWIVAVVRMRGMDAGPGTDLGGLGWYVAIWVTMMAGMMFPAAAPMVLVFHRVSRERAKRGQRFVPSWVFVFSYFAVWVVYGLGAYGFYRLIVHFDFGLLEWGRGGRYVAGSAIAGAGLYELTPLKSVCLRHCRGPLHFVLRHWRQGLLGAIRMGVQHGVYCVGCCWGLMVVLFALGVMSLTWMAVVAALIFAQKVLPRGEQLTRVFAVGFISAGVWVSAAPGSVPGLTDPNSNVADRGRMLNTHRMPGKTRPRTEMSQVKRDARRTSGARMPEKTEAKGIEP